MRKVHIFSLIALLMISITLLMPKSAAQESGKVYHVPFKNTVEDGLKVFLERAIIEANENDASKIILEIHTPGGLVDSAEEIAKVIDQSEVPIIAFINSKAHSAGAYLALHAEEIYMVPNATIGSAAIIDQAGNAASLKAESAWIGEMKAAAESSGRDPLYAIAMADKSIDLPEYSAPVGKLLTLTADDAVKVKYSEGTVANFSDLLTQLDISENEVVTIEPTLIEKIARIITNPVVVTLLLTIGGLGLMFELFSPGFGIPGLIGLSSFGLFFVGHTVAGYAEYGSVILFVIGLILVLAELFIPGGIVGVIGGALMIISLVFTGKSIVYMTYSILIALFIVIIGMVVLMKFFGKKLHVFNKLVLRDATTTEEGYVSNVSRTELIGKIGDTITPLRPAGTVLIENERIDVVSEGSYIDSNKKVEVMFVEGSRIVVRELKKGVE